MADPMEWFVNRLKQLQGFQKMARGETDKRIMIIQAPSGMGKTWLIHRVRRDCAALSLPTFHVDFRDGRAYDYLALVRAVRDQMGIAAFNAMTETINRYATVNIQVVTPEASAPSGVQISAGQQVSVGGDVAGGSIIKDNNFIIHAESSQLYKFAEAQITDAFFACLAALATPEKKCVFLFDSYDQIVGAEIDQWLRDNLLTRLRDQQLANTLAIIAGRQTPELGDEWKSRLASTGLEPFSQDDVTDYVVNKRKVSGLDVGTVFKTCGGRPYLLSQMVELATVGTQKDEDWL